MSHLRQVTLDDALALKASSWEERVVYGSPQMIVKCSWKAATVAHAVTLLRYTASAAVRQWQDGGRHISLTHSPFASSSPSAPGRTSDRCLWSGTGEAAVRPALASFLVSSKDDDIQKAVHR